MADQYGRPSTLIEKAKALVYCLEQDETGSNEDAHGWCVDILKDLYGAQVARSAKMRQLADAMRHD